MIAARCEPLPSHLDPCRQDDTCISRLQTKEGQCWMELTCCELPLSSSLQKPSRSATRIGAARRRIAQSIMELPKRPFAGSIRCLKSITDQQDRKSTRLNSSH